MRFSFTISYEPEPTLNTADTLSRLPLSSTDSSVPDTDTYVASVISAVLIRDAVLDDVKAATATDYVLQNIARYSQSTWPEVTILSLEVRRYAHSKEHVIEYEGLVMYDVRLVIP